MAAHQQAESAAKEELARVAELLLEHDREAQRALAALAATFAAKRAELVALQAAALGVVEREEALSLEVFSALPRELVRYIFSLVPVNQRMRCREVCPEWRAFLEEGWLWRECDRDGQRRTVPQRADDVQIRALRAERG